VLRNIFFNRKSMIIFMLLIMLHVTFGIAGAASAKGPMDQLQVSVDEILKILQAEDLRQAEQKDKRKQLVLNVVADMFDFREMARSSLGPSWKSLTAEEQEKFIGLFRNLIEERYIGKVDSYNNQKVIYKKERVKGDMAIIYTAIVDKNLEIPIDYKLKEDKGKWLINDLKIENVSLIANYRRDFDAIMRKEQFPGLVAKIKEQLDKLETEN
jgi:phospholipid transport system substrate-binding protein